MPASDAEDLEYDAPTTPEARRSGESRRPSGTAWDGALRYLGMRAHSRLEIEQKLARRGFEAAEIQEALERLDSAELLDDRAFASELTRSLLSSKSASRRQVERQLAMRGVSKEDAQQALAGITVDGERDRAEQLARKKMRQLLQVSKEVRWRRTLTFLARRGFSQELSYAAVRAAESALDGEDYAY